MDIPTLLVPLFGGHSRFFKSVLQRDLYSFIFYNVRCVRVNEKENEKRRKKEEDYDRI